MIKTSVMIVKKIVSRISSGFLQFTKKILNIVPVDYI